MAEATETENVTTAKVDTENAQKQTTNLRQRLKELKNELNETARDSEEYKKIIEEIAAIQKEMTQRTKDLRLAQMDLGKTFGALLGTMSSLSAGFQTVTGAINLLGKDSGVLSETFMKLQSAMAITNGLKQLQVGIKQFDSTFKALNKTIAANPLMAIATVLIALIQYFIDWDDALEKLTAPFKVLWEEIEELLPSMNSLGGVSEIITAGLSALFAVIGNIVSGPITAIVKVLQGDFSGALDTLKEHFDVVTIAQDAFNDSLDKQKKKAEEAAEANSKLSKSLKDDIEYLEAVNGAQWKQSEEGVEMYRKYYKALLDETEEGSEEWRKARNNLIAYERSITEKMQAEYEQRLKLRQAEDERNKMYEEEYQKALIELQEIYTQRTFDAIKGDNELRLQWYESQAEGLRAQMEKQKEILDSEESTNEQKAKAQETYNSLLKQELATEDNIKNTLTQIETEQMNAQARFDSAWAAYNNYFDNKLEIEMMSESLEYYKGYLEERKEQIEDEMALQWEIANNEMESLEARAEALEKYNNLQEQADKIEQQSSNVDKKIQQEKRRQQDATLQTTQKVLGAASDLMDENSVAGKAVAVADTTISTYRSAQAAFESMASIPIVGPALGATAAAAAIVQGIANVKNILSVDAGSGDNVSAPNMETSVAKMPEVNDIVNESYTTVTGFDTDVLNDLTPVLVVEDVNDAQNRVRVAESNASF